MSEVKALVECPVIVGTAGHVDHGKSALIEALTGKNPDRLEVERRRGMTVELGFGELALPSGKIVGLVDVPGHAHYLRAMVQGATGIDVGVLVVSAVEGVMPQTREHVHVLELLGVTHMVVALTMCDLADAEMTELAELDVDDFLSGTVFAGAPIVPVSSKTGEGIDGLLAVLDEQVGVCWDACRDRAERSDAAPRLPIDRCFTIKGVGTVVTGTLHDAPVAVGDELMALPSRTVCRVRGIQVHGDTPRALPGQRVALNLVGDGVAALDRGEMLGVADRFGQTLRFMMTFTYLGREGAKPRVLESGARVHVMAGTAEVVGRIMFMEGEAPMAVGETRTVQVRLEEPLPLRAGDHAVVLSYSPVMLIGGGRVLLSRCRRSRELAEGERALYVALEVGDMLGVADRFGQTLRFMMTFTYLGREGAKPRVLESGARVHVMAGTAEVVGRIMFMEGEAPMAVGETRTVQVRLEEPLPLRAGDHAVVLSYSPVMLIGGGRVLLSRCRRSRELAEGERALYVALEVGDIAGGVGAWLALQTLPVTTADVAEALDLGVGEADAALRGLVAQGSVRKLAAGDAGLLADAVVLDAAMDSLAATLSAMHAAAPKETGFTPGAVAHAAWPAADEGVAAALIAEGCSRGVCAAEGAEVFDPHSAAAAARVVREACERIVALLDEAGLDAPALPEVGEQLQLDRDTMTRALRELSLNRSIVKVERDVALSAAAEVHARELVAAAIEAAGGAATTSVLREALGVSRKRAISILEHLDAVRFTVLDKEAGGLRSLR